MQKLIKREDLRCITEKDAIVLLSQGYALKGQVRNQYLIIHNEQLMIIEQEGEYVDESGYYMCHNLDLPMLVKNSSSVYEVQDIPWYESAPRGKPIMCYPLQKSGEPEKSLVILLTLSQDNCKRTINGFPTEAFIPVPKDELLSYLYVYK